MLILQLLSINERLTYLSDDIATSVKTLEATVTLAMKLLTVQ